MFVLKNIRGIEQSKIFKFTKKRQIDQNSKVPTEYSLYSLEYNALDCRTWTDLNCGLTLNMHLF